LYDLATRTALAFELADAFLAGPWTAELLAESGAGTLDRWPPWMDALAFHVVAAYRRPPEDRNELIALVERFFEEHPTPSDDAEPPGVVRVIAARNRQLAAEQARPGLEHDWPIAKIDSVDALAATLELSDGQLAWLADVRGLERSVSDEKLRNYRYRTIPRRAGLPRVIEVPKARLKEVQRWVLRSILDPIPPHETAHGFTRGRSAITHARLHTAQPVVLRLDLKDFFASIAAARVFGLFRTVGYERRVAHVLTGLTTNVVPSAVWREFPAPASPELIQPRFWLGRRLATPHLPQGAPTSPALANLAAFSLDRRLSGVARAFGLRYSRYADDLTFSGPRDLRRTADRVAGLVATTARAEGFSINAAKTSLRTDGGRQSVCGIVVNVRPNVGRDEYDRLKALLHNCARHGPANQNRFGMANFEDHLRGRIAWVASVNPQRGERLRRRFAEIDWSGGTGEA
jgi:RNA-directed DNA polymerase